MCRDPVVKKKKDRICSSPRQCRFVGVPMIRISEESSCYYFFFHCPLCDTVVLLFKEKIRCRQGTHHYLSSPLPKPSAWHLFLPRCHIDLMALFLRVTQVPTRDLDLKSCYQHWYCLLRALSSNVHVLSQDVRFILPSGFPFAVCFCLFIRFFF